MPPARNALAAKALESQCRFQQPCSCWKIRRKAVWRQCAKLNLTRRHRGAENSWSQIAQGMDSYLRLCSFAVLSPSFLAFCKDFRGARTPLSVCCSRAGRNLQTRLSALLWLRLRRAMPRRQKFIHASKTDSAPGVRVRLRAVQKFFAEHSGLPANQNQRSFSP